MICCLCLTFSNGFVFIVIDILYIVVVTVLVFAIVRWFVFVSVISKLQGKGQITFCFYFRWLMIMCSGNFLTSESNNNIKYSYWKEDEEMLSNKFLFGNFIFMCHTNTQQIYEERFISMEIGWFLICFFFFRFFFVEAKKNNTKPFEL